MFSGQLTTPDRFSYHTGVQKPGAKRPAPQSHVPKQLYIYPPKFQISDDFFSHLQQISYYFIKENFPMTFLAVSSYMLHVYRLCPNNSIFLKSQYSLWTVFRVFIIFLFIIRYNILRPPTTPLRLSPLRPSPHSKTCIVILTMKIIVEMIYLILL